ncbi:MAG: phage terminase large subunit, partial [Candidatus Cloacimonetes bacterium]|nr:phage terminase large subunit [Candidatus Cloacimonadota bacterium]
MQSRFDINNAYRPAFFDKDHRFHVIYGGAGSGKSVFVAQKYKYLMLNEPGHNILITRKTARSNRYSTFALMKQVIGQDYSLFRVNKSDMTIKSLVNGNQIMFAGLDDVEKLKSITFDNINEMKELTRIGSGKLIQITWAHDNKTRAIASTAGVMVIDSFHIIQFIDPKDSASSVAFSLDDEILAIGTNNGDIQLWNWKIPELKATLKGHT